MDGLFFCERQLFGSLPRGCVHKRWQVGVGERRGMAIVINENLVAVPNLFRRHCIVAPHAPFIASKMALVKPVSNAQKH